MVDGGHLGIKMQKIKNGLMQGTFPYKVSTIQLRFSLFHMLPFLVTDAILTNLFLFNFKINQCRIILL